MRTARIGVFIALFAAGAAAHAQVHSITYSQVSVAPGTIVNINGEPYVAVQLPMREFTTDKRYAVRFLTPLIQGDFISATLGTQHSTTALPSTNATIDTFPALITVSDGRSYSISSDFLGGDNIMEVHGTVSAGVQVKVGDVVASFFLFLTRLDQEAALAAPNQYRGTGVATYGKYTDPTNLINAPGLDRWVDYIRIIPLN